MSDKKTSPIETRFVSTGPEPASDRHLNCRRMLVGPWCNQPEQYEGYNGMVGWSAVTRFRSGRWAVTFTSGYWHSSPPCTDEMLQEPFYRNLFEARRERRGGMPIIRAPRGGRAHVIYSEDQGHTWLAPETLVDTEYDDRCPTILELKEGVWLATFFASGLRPMAEIRARGDQEGKKKRAFAMYMLSYDEGKTWSDPKPADERDGAAHSFGNGSAIQLSDGSVIWVISGINDQSIGNNMSTTVYRSTDQAKSFKLLSTISADHELWEPTVAEVPSGRLVNLNRREGDIAWSDDAGRTWSAPVSTGVEMADPHFLMMPNGVLACFHYSYQGRGVRVILSRDEGKTWHGPKERYGYAVDTSVYGYSHPMLLEDGTVYITYLHTGGHTPADARSEALWGLRVRVNDTADGIEVLPAPGSPAAEG